MSQIGASIAFEMIFIAELLRYFTWFYVLQQASGAYLVSPFRVSFKNLLSPFFISLLFLLAITSLFFNDHLVAAIHIENPNAIQLGWILIFAVLGLVLTEQLYRNTQVEQRSKINYLCISASAIFIYDFFVFSDAFLVQNIDYQFWSARGFVNIIISPTLLIAAVRNPELSPNIHISRKFVFHTATLLGSGLYLIIMSLVAYYINVVGGEWGGLLQSTFLFSALLLLFSLFFSSTLKAKIKRYVNRHFSNKYDYRDEWNRFSETLFDTSEDLSINQRSLQAICQIIDARGARLWLKNTNQYFCCADWHMPHDAPLSESINSDFIRYVSQQQELFTKQEYLKQNQQQDFNDHWFINSDGSWLILPLWVNNDLIGFIHLNESISTMSLDLEDRELLTTITHHVSLSLSQSMITKSLQQAEKFKSINQMTAFLTHDLKTLLSQLFLLVENGKIHKDNPAFIDDMLNTLEHVSNKMQRLVHQLKEPMKNDKDDSIFVVETLQNIISDYKHQPVVPTLSNPGSMAPKLKANKEEFQSALKHIIQNAVDSVNKEGMVNIELINKDNDVFHIVISDNGEGMSADFIANRLFQPFDSTKGVSGMGIGVYQSQQYIRSLKGDIQVTSKLESGSTFTIILPINSQ